MFTIDLNCDLGEGFGEYKLGNDEEMMKYISSANIACGFHGGDPNIIHKTVALASKYQVKIGAHPGLPDLIGFGRRTMDITERDAYNLVLYQIGALNAFVIAQNEKLHHVKPHGALYNMCAVNQKLAEAVAKAVFDFDPSLALYGLANSQLISAGKKYGLLTAQEVFADRTYQSNGTLTPRTHEKALITNPKECIRQTLQMIKQNQVKTLTGEIINIYPDTVCLHGDGVHAREFAQQLNLAFENEGISIA